MAIVAIPWEKPVNNYPLPNDQRGDAVWDEQASMRIPQGEEYPETTQVRSQ